MERKILAWIFQKTKWQNIRRKKLKLVTLAKPSERNQISSDSSTKKNAIRTIYIQAKIHNVQEDCKERLCGDKDEAIVS